MEYDIDLADLLSPLSAWQLHTPDVHHVSGYDTYCAADAHVQDDLYQEEYS